MDLAVRCSRKAVKLNHSLTLSNGNVTVLMIFLSLAALEVVIRQLPVQPVMKMSWKWCNIIGEVMLIYNAFDVMLCSCSFSPYRFVIVVYIWRKLWCVLPPDQELVQCPTDIYVLETKIFCKQIVGYKCCCLWTETVFLKYAVEDHLLEVSLNVQGSFFICIQPVSNNVTL